MGLRQSATSVFKRIGNHLPRYSRRVTSKLVKEAVDVEKARRGIVTQQYIETVDKLVQQPWPYLLLKNYANRHPFLRIVHGAIIREVVRNRWDAKEKFAKKCVTCGRLFDEPVAICPDCGDKGFLRDPNPQEKKRLEAFLKDPNRDDEMVDIFKSLMKDNLAVDDWWLSVKNIGANQWVIYNEDAAEMFIAADKKGRLGNGVYFCPDCWVPEQNEKTYPKKISHCPQCDGLLKETAYVQKVAGIIKARFGRDEIIHGNSDPWLPQQYGNSKVVAVLTELRSALAMSNYNFGIYSKGHIDKLIFLKGEEQSKADEIANAAKEQTDKITIDALTGRIGREVSGSLWIGTREGGEIHDVMPDPEKMQSLDWYEFWFVKITGGIYGVQPVMMNAPTRGPGGYFQRMQVVVQNDRTREDQAMIEDAVNEQLLPKMGIHDWLFKFNEIEPRNELEEAQIWQAKIAAGTLAVEAGLKAELTDEGDLKVSGKFVKPEMSSQATAYLMPKPPKAPVPKQQQPFAMDKTKKGKSWLVTEVKED